LQFDHPAGQEIRLVSKKAPVSLALNGTDYEFFLTNVADGRVYAQDLIRQITAAGISIVFTILYPNDIGTGKAGTQYSEIAYLYGADPVAGNNLIWPQFST
jgi:hypothetical protein